MNILNVEKVSKTYGEKELFNNISLGINSGDKIGLIGVNGTGKSTLLKIIAGIEEPDEGQVVKGKGIELAYLAQRGYVSFVRDSVGTKTVPKCVWLCDEAVRDRLASAGKALAEEFAPEFDALREKYAEKVLKETPPHLSKAQSFILNSIFVADGSFIRSCIDILVGDGKLKMPTDEQRRSLGIVIETVG